LGLKHKSRRCEKKRCSRRSGPVIVVCHVSGATALRARDKETDISEMRRSEATIGGFPTRLAVTPGAVA
jgi:hypothetical protein